VKRELNELIDLLKAHHGLSHGHAFHSAVHLLSTDNGSVPFGMRLSPLIADHVRHDRQKLDFLEVDRHSVFVETRYKWIRDICAAVTRETGQGQRSLSERIDRFVLHRYWGYLIFLALMGIMFQSVFSWALTPMELISDAFDETGRFLTAVLPPGDLRDLLVDGALAGVSAVVVFLPQILFLFFFLGLLEDTGYMARAAFLMDKLMSSVGLHGKSFIPLLSSFACAIPGIMATRTLDNSKDRLATMLVAPLMGCSARLPVYTLLIAAFIPSIYLFGFVSLPALVLLSLYMLGLVAALLIAWIFRKTFLKGRSSTFIMELPPYRKPSIRSILIQMWERSRIFLQSAGTFILGVSIVLWFLATYPRLENATPAQQLEMSYAGQAGRTIEPLIKPLGFDWKIGIGLIGSLLQREVFVSTMGTIYNIQNADDDAGSVSLGAHLKNDRDPVTGDPSFTILTAICLMVYYVFAMQCMSTVAIMRRETNGWKWPLFQVGYMTALAYGTTFIVYQIGTNLGWGV
ncbi:MAG: ferrous iron transport protein B, partial [Ignavibacteria bacterium]|nr:ferrous iron transport protein B [Ignavibacteria bacterium]